MIFCDGRETITFHSIFSPLEYLSLISDAEEVLIEREENYQKQTFRNRCYILSATGPLVLSVPVLKGSFHKTAIKDIEIDYSKRWQQVHLRAMTSSYKSSAYFEYYFENIEKVILGNHKFLFDLNKDSLDTILKILKMKITISYTSVFETVIDPDNDYRYRISPKKKKVNSQLATTEYFQVFNNKTGFVEGLSIIDLIFNAGPDSAKYLYNL